MHERNYCCARRQPGDRSAAAKIGRRDLIFFSEKPERECVIGTCTDAVHAHEALGLTPRLATHGIIAALAVKQAAVALVAFFSVLMEAEDGPP
jgi:hypothetical protein